MRHLIDLDVLADFVLEASEKWRENATVSPLTWRDEEADWPQPLTTDRATVRTPESLGLVLESARGELHIVAWAGGWFDADMLKDDELGALSPPEFVDVAGAFEHINEMVDRFLE